MSSRAKIWLLPAMLYALFVFWYTDFSGPLSNAEIDKFTRALTDNGVSAERVGELGRFMREDSGRQFLMVNAIHNNAEPPAVEGAPADADADTLMGLYLEHMLPALVKRASHPVLIGGAVFPVIDLIGLEGAEEWTSAAIFRYRSRRTFMEVISNPVFLGRHDFKTAALEKTIAYPIEPSLYLGDPRLLLGLILFSLTALIQLLLPAFSRRGKNKTSGTQENQAGTTGTF
ncbi:hypothetical protein [Biformimicrobium ophioploci]|uniref:Uncharacterized protein n=1 Tax=Biformimicrobium ophioploci TaxID=3036711 RepID=A0ABQ6LXF7_9GAMM|nr:hypothetical protein [Microbulbifer sp. NKW57]GMG86707.1 hypothetical protein MNKW57_10280 [Microbulbifer sp. NKW57]